MTRGHARPAHGAWRIAVCCVVWLAYATSANAATCGDGMSTMRFSEFYSGWRSWSYALKDIADSVQASRWKDVHHEAARFCDIAEGLKRFAGKLEHDKGEALMTRLERSVALMASLDEVSAQDGVGANAMVQQVQLVQATIPSLVPSCWLSFASTQHGVHRPSCR